MRSTEPSQVSRSVVTAHEIKLQFNFDICDFDGLTIARSHLVALRYVL